MFITVEVRVMMIVLKRKSHLIDSDQISLWGSVHVWCECVCIHTLNVWSPVPCWLGLNIPPKRLKSERFPFKVPQNLQNRSLIFLFGELNWNGSRVSPGYWQVWMNAELSVCLHMFFTTDDALYGRHGDEIMLDKKDSNIRELSAMEIEFDCRNI